MQQSQGATHTDGDRHGDHQPAAPSSASGDGVKGEPDARRSEHHAFDPDVHHTGPLAPEPCERSERDGGRQSESLDQQRQEVGLSGGAQRHTQHEHERNDQRNSGQERDLRVAARAPSGDRHTSGDELEDADGQHGRRGIDGRPWRQVAEAEDEGDVLDRHSS